MFSGELPKFLTSDHESDLAITQMDAVYWWHVSAKNVIRKIQNSEISSACLIIVL